MEEKHNPVGLNKVNGRGKPLHIAFYMRLSFQLMSVVVLSHPFNIL